MKSYSTLLSLYQSYTENTSSANQDIGATNINESVRVVATSRGGTWPWLEKVRTMLTVASQESYKLPASVRRVLGITVTVGTQPYIPTMVYDQTHWEVIQSYKLGTSDIPLFVYQRNKTLLFAPIPATSANTITIHSRENVIDLNAVDYTTGTITSIANAATTVTGSGTSWTTSMAGRYIRITATTAAGGGDELWYEIASVTSATVLELNTPYEGTTIAAATAAYTIGQMSQIPESYDVLPVYRATSIYWDMKNPARAKLWWSRYDGGKEAGYLPAGQPAGGLLGQMIDEASNTFEGAYVPPFGSQISAADGSLYGIQSDASGF